MTRLEFILVTAHVHRAGNGAGLTHSHYTSPSVLLSPLVGKDSNDTLLTLGGKELGATR